MVVLSMRRPRALKMITALSTTISPRVILPPLVLYSSILSIHSFSRCGRWYLLGRGLGVRGSGQGQGHGQGKGRGRGQGRGQSQGEREGQGRG